MEAKARPFQALSADNGEDGARVDGEAGNRDNTSNTIDTVIMGIYEVSLKQ